MKKVTSILFFILSVNLCFAQFPETFDTEIPDTWAVFIGENGEGPVQNWRHDANGFAFSQFEEVLETSEDWLVTPKVAISSENSVLTFDFTDANTEDFKSEFQVRISTGNSQNNISDFETAVTFVEENVTATFLSTVQISLDAYIGKSIYVAFVHVQKGGDTFFLDNVNFDKKLTAPKAAVNPTPADKDTNVPVSAEDVDNDGEADNFITFSWDPPLTGDAPQFYDFYFGDSQDNINSLLTLPASQTEITLGGLEAQTSYFWGVVARNNGGDALQTTLLWSFTTGNITLSVDSNKIIDKQVLSHFYNGNSQELNIATQGNDFEKIVIYNYAGKQVLQQSLNGTKAQISLANLSSGSYIATVFINNQLQTFKFLKR